MSLFGMDFNSMGNSLGNLSVIIEENEETQNVKTDGTRILKFQVFIRNINNTLKKHELTPNFINLRDTPESALISPLDIIFKRDSLNIYGRIIIQIATFDIACPLYCRTWYEEYSDKNFNSEQIKYSAAKDFISFLRHYPNYYKATKYIFIFWGLMVLSVDETDADDKLSLICDFAKMLLITDDELIDIANIIKLIYHETDENYAFITTTIPNLFANLLRFVS